MRNIVFCLTHLVAFGSLVGSSFEAKSITSSDLMDMSSASSSSSGNTPSVASDIKQTVMPISRDCFGDTVASYQGMSARKLYDSHNYDNMEVKVTFNPITKEPTIRCSKDIVPGEEYFKGDPIKWLKMDGGKCTFNLEGRYISTFNGDFQFLRLPIYGVRGMCSIVSVGLNPEKVNYLHEYLGKGISANNLVWQRIVNDFSMNVNSFWGYWCDGRSWCTEKKRWACANKNTTNPIELYTCSSFGGLYGVNMANHATTLIPLDSDGGNLAIKEGYGELFKRIAYMNIKHGGHFGHDLASSHKPFVWK